jgi:hypothetical protein
MDKKALRVLQPDKASEKVRDILEREGFTFKGDEMIRRGIAYKFESPSGSKVKVDFVMGSRGVLHLSIYADNQKVKDLEANAPRDLEDAGRFISKNANRDGPSRLRDELIRLGSQKPELRKHLRPVLDKIAMTGIQKELDYAMEQVSSLPEVRSAEWRESSFEDGLYTLSVDLHEGGGGEWKIQVTTPDLYTVTGPDRQEDMVEEGEVSAALILRAKSWIL